MAALDRYQVRDGWYYEAGRVGRKGEWTATAFKDRDAPAEGEDDREYLGVGRFAGKGAKDAALMAIRLRIDEREKNGVPFPHHAIPM